MAAPFAAGALGSTAPDLLTWQDALTTNRLLSATSYRRMTTAGTLNDGTRTTYGYGVTIGVMHGHTKWSHAGTISGFRALLAHYPDDRLTMALLCNNGRAALEVLESRLARHVLGIAEPIVREIVLSSADLDWLRRHLPPRRRPAASRPERRRTAAQRRTAAAGGRRTLRARRRRGDAGHLRQDHARDRAEGERSVARRVAPDT